MGNVGKTVCMYLSIYIVYYVSDILKPCVNHRDFNTRNLLLTENLSCVVSDLGFAIHTQGSKYFVNGEEQHAETSSLTDVSSVDIIWFGVNDDIKRPSVFHRKDPK